ncbi:phage tail protein [Blautia intestinalis]|uniref:phage tail protein n=1 Tax=Blautia intestinalis TaxID=2763028 RepID=UPI0022E36402|nr:hypothetical protein [Blautia intestinalis]
MTQTALDSYAMANGFGKTTSAMSEAEKVALRYQFVQDKLSAAQGDFARTSGSWANQCRVLSLQMQSLMATIGQGLINLFTPIIRVINTVIGKLATLANAFKSFTELITGNKSSGSDSSGVAAVAGAADDAGTGLENASDSASNLASNTDKVGQAAQNAAKKMKALMGFDKINKLDAQSDSSSGSSSSPSTGAGGTGALGSEVDFGNLAEGDTVLDKTSKSAQKLAELLKKLWKPFQDAWNAEGKKTLDAVDYAFRSIGKLAKSVGKSLVSVLTNGTGTKMLTTMLQIGQNVLKTIGNIATQLDKAWNKNNVGTGIIQAIANIYQTILNVINRITSATAKWSKNLDFYPLLSSIKGLYESIAPLIEKIGNLVADIYEKIVLPLLKWIIETGLPTLINVLTGVFDFLGEHQWIIDAIGAALVGAFAAEKIVPAISTIITAFSGLMEFTTGLIALFTGSGGLLGGIQAIITAMGGPWTIAIGAAVAAGVLLWKNWDAIKEAATVLKDWVVEKSVALKNDVVGAFTTLKDNASGALGVLRENVKEKWNAIKSKFSEFSGWLKGIFQTDWSKSFGTLGSILNTFLGTVQRIWGNIKRVFNGIVEFITGVFSGNWKQAWNGIKEIFRGVFGSLIALAKAPLNAVIDLINGLMNKLNSGLAAIENAFSFSYDFKNPITGTRHYGHYGMSLPRVPTIPHLAQGAYVRPNTPQLAMIGDNLHQGEVVAPENKLREMAIEAVRAAGGSGVTREDLETIMNRAVMRIIAALSQMGFYLDGKKLAEAENAVKAEIDRRFNTVDIK